jgi:hypothetical protein
MTSPVPLAKDMSGRKTQYQMGAMTPLINLVRLLLWYHCCLCLTGGMAGNYNRRRHWNYLNHNRHRGVSCDILIGGCETSVRRTMPGAS